MNGLMMDFQLTLPTILKRAEKYFPPGDRDADAGPSFHRYTFADFGKRARQLAVALKGVGLQPGYRVATLCWNHYQHLEAYLGIRAAASSCTRSTYGCTRTTSATSPRTQATRR